MKTVAIVATLDTKGHEAAFVKSVIEKNGLKTLIIDVGVNASDVKADIPNSEVAKAAGVSIEEILKKNERSFAMSEMSKGAAFISQKLYNEKRFDGVISMGGSGGSSLAASFMQALPVGVPKLLVSTMASGDTRPYVGVSDITMMYSVVDVAGINSISSVILSNAANAISGMLQNEVKKADDNKKVIAATMFGVTTPCVTAAQKVLEDAGYEVLVFHATGAGGQSMESLIKSGFIDGVLDITTTEWCDELVGGVLNAGTERLDAAALGGIPQVVSVGALDMVNFGPPDTIPSKFNGRKFYEHNTTVTLMRTTVEENKELGKIIAEKLNQTKGKTAIVLPLKGVSAIDIEGGAFWGPQEDKALFDAIRANIDTNKVELIEKDTDINDSAFAEFVSKKLISYMK